MFKKKQKFINNQQHYPEDQPKGGAKMNYDEFGDDDDSGDESSGEE